MEDFYKQHPDLIRYGEALTKYVKKDIDGNVIEIWERERDNNGVPKEWQNKTEEYKLAEEIAKMQGEINKQKIKLALKTCEKSKKSAVN